MTSVFFRLTVRPQRIAAFRKRLIASACATGIGKVMDQCSNVMKTTGVDDTAVCSEPNGNI